MADYPDRDTLPIAKGSRSEPVSGMRVDRTSGGAARGQCFYDYDRQVFMLLHNGIDSTAKAALDACYNTYRTATLTFEWIDGVTYTVMFAAPPQYKYHKYQAYVDARVRLVGV